MKVYAVVSLGMLCGIRDFTLYKRRADAKRALNNIIADCKARQTYYKNFLIKDYEVIE